MNKWLIRILKALVLVAAAVWLGKQFYKAWLELSGHPESHLVVDWRWGGIAILGFTGSMLTSSLVWRFLAFKMADRSPTLPLLGAYTFSQMGKYVPGKVALLLMRIDRASRFGMSAATCTLSTLLENALYMVSGGLVGMLAIVKVIQGLAPGQRSLVWPVTIIAVAALAILCAPPVFYGIVNRLLCRMKKPELNRDEWLGAGTLALCVFAFIPCWLCGGLALWGTTQTVHPTPLAESWWFAGAYALSVIIGMASLLPGGTGIREALLLAAVTIQLEPAVGHARAVALAGIVAILQRVFQLIVEVLLGIIGGLLTSRKPSDPPFPPQIQPTVKTHIV
jgi:glycosyltransferase 2 family protein